MTTAELSKPKTGRPRGAKNKRHPIIETIGTRCPKCSSTERAGYRDVKTHECSGIAPDGMPFNFVSFKQTKCLKCGLRRIDKSYANVI